MKDQVRRMAENDEPKCKNCVHWDRTVGMPNGICLLHMKAVYEKRTTEGGLGIGGIITTDLSLCSAWEPKE